jgi:hypothetical protein
MNAASQYYFQDKSSGCRLWEAIYFSRKGWLAVLNHVLFTSCDVKLFDLFFNFNNQPEEEAGSAGEQPASNKAVRRFVEAV